MEVTLGKRKTKTFGWWVGKGILVAAHPRLMLIRLVYNFRRFLSDCLSFFGHYKYPHRIIFLAGMAMGGSTWVKNLLIRIPGYYSRSMPMPRDVSYKQDICDSAFKKIPRFGFTMFKTHLNPNQENLECIMRNGVDKIIVVYRDLRDVAVGRYYRLVDFPKPDDASDCVDYSNMDKEDALDHSIDVVTRFYIPWIRGWFELADKNPDRCLFVKFEDLKKDTEKEYRRMLDFYDIDLSGEHIKRNIEASRGRGNIKKNMNEALVLPFGISSNFRSGKVGGWRKEMNAAHIDKCKRQLGDVLVELDYEQDMEW